MLREPATLLRVERLRVRSCSPGSSRGRPPRTRVAIAGFVRDSAASRGSLASGFGGERSREELVIVVWVETD